MSNVHAFPLSDDSAPSVSFGAPRGPYTAAELKRAIGVTKRAIAKEKKRLALAAMLASYTNDLHDLLDGTKR